MHVETLLSRSPRALLAHLSGLQAQYKSHTLLFALSHNAPASTLPTLIDRLTTFSPAVVGCLAAPLPASPSSSSSSPPLIACALALFAPGTATPFRSTIPGRAAPQVGRWHAFRDRHKADENEGDGHTLPEDGVEWADVWDRSVRAPPLPLELRDLDPTTVSDVLYLSDLAPEGIVNALSNAYPGANKLGLRASSTPFITGNPVTLFHNRQIHGSSAVGLALTLDRKRRHPSARTSFSGMHAISGEMLVTNCEGNMITGLASADDSARQDINPTQRLLGAIRTAGLDATPDAMGAFSEGEGTFLLGTTQDAGCAQQMYTITAGDPSRGSLALASERAPVEGTRVQFFHQQPWAGAAMPKSETGGKTVRFVTCEEPCSVAEAEQEGDGEVVVLRDTFIGASENGFVLDGWTCGVRGGEACIEL